MCVTPPAMTRIFVFLLLVGNVSCHHVTPAAAPDISHLYGTRTETRVDLYGTGTYDTYWTSSHNAMGDSCVISLYAVADSSMLWQTTVANCTETPYVEFHSRSFMGGPARDFTFVLPGPVTPTNSLGYYLYAGDGDTGHIREMAFPIGNAYRIGVLRRGGVAVVDFQLQQYPGPALLVRTTGGDYDQHGHLVYFPKDSNSHIDLTTDTLLGTAITDPRLREYLFPGPDVPAVPLSGTKYTGPNLYTSIYNNFNSGLLPCQTILEEPWDCGIPDGGDDSTYDYWNAGSGWFMDKILVGDIDADGVDDALMVWFWKTVVYPGRPRGRVDLLGGPQYDAYYNPQGGHTSCASGRNYGLTALARIGGSPYLAQIDIGGTPVGNFGDAYQNVSRNIAVLETRKHATVPTYVRSLLWNRPLGTSGLNECDSDKRYANAIHYPADGLLRTPNGEVRYIQVNRWTQIHPDNARCVNDQNSDRACAVQLLNSMTGYWSWEVLDVMTGATVKAIPNMYVWDILPSAEANKVWLLYSANANIWNLNNQYATSKEDIYPKEVWGSLHSADLVSVEVTTYRSDFTLALLDTSDLALSKTQGIAEPTAPFMKVGAWQNYGGAVASNWYVPRVFTIAVDQRPLLGIVLRTADGYVIFAHDGTAWTESARYDANGSLRGR